MASSTTPPPPMPIESSSSFKQRTLQPGVVTCKQCHHRKGLQYYLLLIFNTCLLLYNLGTVSAQQNASMAAPTIVSAAAAANTFSHVPLIVSNMNNLSSIQRQMKTTTTTTTPSTLTLTIKTAIETTTTTAVPAVASDSSNLSNNLKNIIIANKYVSKVPTIKHDNSTAVNNQNNSNPNISSVAAAEPDIPTLLQPPPPLIAISSTSSSKPSSSAATSKLSPLLSVSVNYGSSPFVQAPSSVFFTNYNSQQNVLQLVRNLDRRLNSIRNVEMRVAAIQEIFDSTHFNSNNMASNFNMSPNVGSKNSSADTLNMKKLNELLERDLHLFSKRLSRKLEKATHVVMELRDFLRYNISNFLLQRTDYKEDDYFDIDFDSEIDETAESSEVLEKNGDPHFYLNSLIETMQNPIHNTNDPTEMEPEQQPLHYNKEQIQILNYLHKDDRNSRVNSPFESMEDNHEYMSNGSHHSARSWEANGFIAQKVRNLKLSLMRNEGLELSLNGRPPPLVDHSATINNKLKFSGNHFKHIYFLSRTDHNINHFYSKEHFRHLYVSAIQKKFVLLLLDVGSAMNTELYELTKTFVYNVLSLLSETDRISIITVSNETQLMILDDIVNNSNETANGLYRATRNNKNYIGNFINNLNIGRALTNHALGFEEAFNHIQQLQNSSFLTSENPIEFVYVTRGLLANLTDSRHVLQVIANGQRSILEPIIINTCAVVTDEKRIMYEKQFLGDVAFQNYTKYDIKVDDWLPVNSKKGKESAGNDRNTLSNAIKYLAGKFFVFTKARQAFLWHASISIFDSLFEERYLQKSLHVHLPAMDEDNSKDVLLSITHALAPFGVVGVNLFLSDIIEDIYDYGLNPVSQQQASGSYKHDTTYAFLIDRNGITITHPAFPRPLAQAMPTYPVDIAFLENATNFLEIRHKMLESNSGSTATTVYRQINKNIEILKRSYHWQSVLGIYVLCLVVTRGKDTSATSFIGATPNFQISNKNSGISLPLQRYTLKENITRHSSNSNYRQPDLGDDYDYMPSLDLLYHRLDIITALKATQQSTAQQPQICRYFKQMATMDSPTLFLSASAFESPFSFLQNSRIVSPSTQARIAESIMAYLKDTTGLLANPGLRPEIRQEVNILYTAMQHLKKRHQDSRGLLKSYIIRRYISTVNGVLQIYPGCLLSNDYDATRRPWFRKAMQHPGKIVATGPYLDAGGAGYIVTIAHTIFEGKANALHSIERDLPVAVVALDVPYAFFYKMILDSTPLCQMKNIKCLLFENEGYLIAHPSMLETSTSAKNQRRPYEHLTHKESYLANDILNHKNLVKKLACANYQNRTLQRYYTFNMALSAGDIWTNVVHGERTKYAITVVRGSNIFAAVLNSTVDGGAFCPCSTIDRVCLNCNRMDQMDCECPCECPMDMDVFNGKIEDLDEDLEQAILFKNYTLQYAYCEPPSEQFVALPTITLNSDQALETCSSINCDVYGTQIECLAVMGCEWCQQDLDGNAFSAAFCTAQATCFNGVLSSNTPYGDLDDIDIISAHGYNPSQKQSSYSAFGPIGGALVVLGIVIGFAIYCYRHNLDAHAQGQFYIDSMQEENYGLPLSRFNFDDCQAHDDPPTNGGYDLSGGSGATARNLMNPADISPYHVSTGSSYRRPPNGESDHGYSTMTPHEDSSDHQCFTLAEPLLLHDKRHSKSDTLSISTSISSPTNRNQAHIVPGHCSTKESRHNVTSPKKFQMPTTPMHVGNGVSSSICEQTILPQTHIGHSNDMAVNSLPHSFLAPVTVHRHMETSES